MSGMGRSRERSKERPTHDNGGRIFTDTSAVEETGRTAPKEPVTRTGDPASCQGEALLWHPREYPGGTTMMRGKRGGLTGAIPEALHGEAPKGQPMIRGETLEVVCVEAPEGQPRNHRRHPRQVMFRPTGEKEERG